MGLWEWKMSVCVGVDLSHCVFRHRWHKARFLAKSPDNMVEISLYSEALIWFHSDASKQLNYQKAFAVIKTVLPPTEFSSEVSKWLSFALHQRWPSVDVSVEATNIVNTDWNPLRFQVGAKTKCWLCWHKVTPRGLFTALFFPHDQALSIKC